MSRIEIHGEGRTVIVQHDGPLADAEKTARRLWTVAGRGKPEPTEPQVKAGAGFQAERVDGPTYKPDVDAVLGGRP